MRAAIMQPYFFPYAGHFGLIAACDQWIVFDVTQYTPRSWMNRNRVLHPTSNWQYVTVPLSKPSIHQRTWEATILSPSAACQAVLARLAHYRRQAPYYEAVCNLVKATFDSTDTSLVLLNTAGLAAVCKYLDLPFRYQICSRLGLDYTAVKGPGDWAPVICSAIGATEYINPIGGADLFDPETFQRRNLGLSFVQTSPLHYPTGTYEQTENLSILDVLMWNSPAQARDAILAHTTVKAAGPDSTRVNGPKPTAPSPVQPAA